MQEPIQFRMDYEVVAGYLRYRPLPAGERVARTQRVSDDVHVDFNASGEILGIELLSFDATALGAAKAFAYAHGLSFPRDLAGLVPDISTTAARA